MLTLSLHLPKYRLDLKVIKRRKEDMEKGKFSKLPIYRFAKKIFAEDLFRRIVGTNLTLMLIATSFIPSYANEDVPPDELILERGATPLTTEHSITYPVESVKVSQGYRVFHPGVDFDGVTGDAIRPIKNGKVEAVQYSKYAYGNAVIVGHGNKLTSLYAHLSKIYVKEEDEVTTHTVIGEMGSSGRASGDHLHLEVRDEGRPINPLTVLPR